MWTLRRSDVCALAALLAIAPCGARADDAGSGSSPSASAPADDPLAAYRERFKLGMDKYRAGSLAEALAYWEPLYDEIGEEKGYRLAYNLGVAYQEYGDATRAAERLQSFVAGVDARRARGEEIASLVADEEKDARVRVETLTETKGRIRIDAGNPPVAVQVDASAPRLAGFVAWVTPGEHVVTYAPGTSLADPRKVTVHAGEEVEVAPTPVITSVPAIVVDAGAPPVARPSYVVRETQRPFSPVLLYVAGGATVALGVAAVALTSHAQSLHDDAFSEWNASGGTNGGSIPAQDRSDANAARTWSNVSIGAAVGATAITAALAAWYFLGKTQREIVVTPGGVAGRF